MQRSIHLVICSFLLNSLILLAFPGSLLLAQEFSQEVSAESLALPEGVFIVEQFQPEPGPESPLKDLDIRAYVLSNGKKGYCHIGKEVPHTSHPQSEALSYKVDFESRTYFARKLSPKELESMFQQLRNQGVRILSPDEPI